MFKDSKAFSSFSVNDLEKSKYFYGTLLDLPLKESMGLQLQLADGAEVFLYQKPDHVPATFTVLNFKVMNIEKAIDEMLSKGIKFEHYSGKIQTDAKGIFRGGGPLIAWFKDPAGNILSVLEKIEN